ncbi:MAG: SIMPL domain-containing protein [Pyrinomonadaceae bacterium]
MNKILLSVTCLLFCLSSAFAQEAGNRVYSNNGNARHLPQLNSGVLSGSASDGKPIQWIETSVLMNMPADAYVAVFGFAQEAKSPAASNEAVNAKFNQFIGLLGELGIKRNDIYIDFISQNRIFDFTEESSTITERLSGFETKKNIAVRFKDRNLLEKMLAAAAQATVFDLIEVNYVVSDTKSVRSRLFEEAVKVIKQKEDRYTNSFGIQFVPMTLANEKYDAFYPSEQYQNYQAFESGSAYGGTYNKTVIRQRKVTTFYYEPLNDSLFDAVINPLGIEPVVQFTLYLRMQYQLKSAGSTAEEKSDSIVRSEMVKIEGGTFLMGGNQKQEAAQPAHSVTVSSFLMDKTEVTNAEYADFVSDSGYRAPASWNNGRPSKNELDFPVSGVSLEDARAFAAWRSKRDGVIYRLPTEAEWEYAARNGADANVYPWGNNFAEKRAAIGKTAIINVSSIPDGANKWGVVDLIGNVWEWTETPITPYQGSEGQVLVKSDSPEYIIRGGSVRSDKNINSTFRQWVDASRRDKLLGFRLVSNTK